MFKPDWVNLDGLDKKASGKYTDYYRGEVWVYTHYKGSSYESWVEFDEKERWIRYENSDGYKRWCTYDEEGNRTIHTEDPNQEVEDHTDTKTLEEEVEGAGYYSGKTLKHRGLEVELQSIATVDIDGDEIPLSIPQGEGVKINYKGRVTVIVLDSNGSVRRLLNLSEEEYMDSLD